jgi:ribokinase
MAIYNLGSINVDYFYTLPHLVRPSETIAAIDFNQGLGGKGANQSVAIAKAGGTVKHIGAMNPSDKRYFDQLQDLQVDVSHLTMTTTATGHGIVMVDEQSAENQIVVYPGANFALTENMVDAGLEEATSSDWALCQNETSQTAYFMKQAKAKGMKLCYSAAPFDAEKTLVMLPLINMLVVNEIEAMDLERELNRPIKECGVDHVLVTLGSRGVRYIGSEGEFTLPSPSVEAVDTTGAGDTFLGLFLARYDLTGDLKASLHFAVTGASIQVTRQGTADAIPTLEEIESAL